MKTKNGKSHYYQHFIMASILFFLLGEASGLVAQNNRIICDCNDAYFDYKLHYDNANNAKEINKKKTEYEQALGYAEWAKKLNCFTLKKGVKYDGLKWNEHTTKAKQQYESLNQKKTNKGEKVVEHQYLELSYDGMIFQTEGGDNSTLVSSDKKNNAWKVEDVSEDWFSAIREDNFLVVKCDSNTSAKPRIAKVVIVSGSFTDTLLIQQGATESYLRLANELDGTQIRNGKKEIFFIPIETNLKDWTVTEAGKDWCKAVRCDTCTSDKVEVHLERNDDNMGMSSRQTSFQCVGDGLSVPIRIHQEERGLIKGRFEDYYDALGGNWNITWVSIGINGCATLGNNLSVLAFRWKPVEADLINFNFDYFMYEAFSANWEPIVRGHFPLSRNLKKGGQWSAFMGIGVHLSMTHHQCDPMLEFGADVNWNKSLSSRFFIKCNGVFSFGASLRFGKWIQVKKRN